MARSAFVFGLLFAGSALACAVCGQGGTANDPNQFAYKVMTIVMSFMPLVAIGGVAGFLVWQVRKHEKEQLEEMAPQHLRGGVSARRAGADGAAAVAAKLPESA